jgi:hypothetical protein
MLTVKVGVSRGDRQARRPTCLGHREASGGKGFGLGHDLQLTQYICFSSTRESFPLTAVSLRSDTSQSGDTFWKRKFGTRVPTHLLPSTTSDWCCRTPRKHKIRSHDSLSLGRSRRSRHLGGTKKRSTVWFCTTGDVHVSRRSLKLPSS